MPACFVQNSLQRTLSIRECFWRSHHQSALLPYCAASGRLWWLLQVQNNTICFVPSLWQVYRLQGVQVSVVTNATVHSGQRFQGKRMSTVYSGFSWYIFFSMYCWQLWNTCCTSYSLASWRSSVMVSSGKKFYKFMRIYGTVQECKQNERTWSQ